MSLALEKAYFNKDLPAFTKAAREAAGANLIDKEYYSSDSFSDNVFKRGTALTTISALTPFDASSLAFVQTLLEAGANPNHKNINLGGLTPIENIISNAEPNYVYADPTELEESLLSLLKLLIGYGAETTPYEGVSGETARFIDSILLDYAAEVDSKSSSSSDKRELHASLCEDLSKQNNLAQLRLLAKSMNLNTSGKKAELCGIISQYLLTQI
ncbi:MAG: SAP domain-containing protein [Candidatus Paceibacterota bacterium]